MSDSLDDMPDDMSVMDTPENLTGADYRSNQPPTTLSPDSDSTDTSFGIQRNTTDTNLDVSGGYSGPGPPPSVDVMDSPVAALASMNLTESDSFQRAPQAPEERSETLPPQSLIAVGEYKFETPIASGTFGAVFVDKTNRYAGKRFNEGPNRAWVKSAKKEINILRKLTHDNVVKIIASHTGPHGFLWMIMERCDMNCENYLTDYNPNILTRISILIQTTGALMYIHGQKIVHRDIKLRNILVIILDKRNPMDIDVKVCDFGLAKQLDSTMHMKSNCGTDIYKAPEVRLGSAKSYDYKVDIFSLGLSSIDIVLYEKGRKIGIFPEFRGNPNVSVGQRMNERTRCDFDLTKLPTSMSPYLKNLVEFIVCTMVRLEPSARCQLEDFHNQVQNCKTRYLSDHSMQSTHHERASPLRPGHQASMSTSMDPHEEHYDEVDESSHIVGDPPIVEEVPKNEPRGWRPDQTFDEETYKDLHTHVVKYKSKKPHIATRPKILLIGPIGVGKSSFISSVNKVFGNFSEQLAFVQDDSAGTSTTRMYQEHNIDSIVDGTDQQLNFQLCDTLGMEEWKGAQITLNEQDFVDILDGKLKSGTKLDSQQREQKLIANPKSSNKIYLVVFVVDATKVTVSTIDSTLNKMRQFKDQYADARGLRSVVLLTKVDNVCPGGVSNIFHSRDIEDLAHKISGKMGVQIADVLPVVNYGIYGKPSRDQSIQIMRCLQRMLSLVNNTLLEKSTQLNDEEQKPHGQLQKEFATINFTEEKCQQLLNYICNFKTNHQGILSVKIQLLGQIGAGKSSFINSFSSVLNDRISDLARTDQSDHSVTTEFCIHSFEDQEGNPVPIRIADCMGLEASHGRGIHEDDIEKLIAGFIRDGYDFNPMTGIKYTDTYYVQNLDITDKVHVLAIVIDGSDWTEMPEKVRSSLKDAVKAAKKTGARCMVIITKIDLMDDTIKNDVTTATKSKYLDETMKDIAEKLSVRRADMFFLKNYESEHDTEMEKNVLILMTVKRLIELAADSIKEHMTRPKQVQEVPPYHHDPQAGMRRSQASPGYPAYPGYGRGDGGPTMYNQPYTGRHQEPSQRYPHPLHPNYGTVPQYSHVNTDPRSTMVGGQAPHNRSSQGYDMNDMAEQFRTMNMEPGMGETNNFSGNQYPDYPQHPSYNQQNRQMEGTYGGRQIMPSRQVPRNTMPGNMPSNQFPPHSQMSDFVTQPSEYQGTSQNAMTSGMSHPHLQSRMQGMQTSQGSSIPTSYPQSMYQQAGVPPFQPGMQSSGMSPTKQSQINQEHQYPSVPKQMEYDEFGHPVEQQQASQSVYKPASGQSQFSHQMENDQHFRSHEELDQMPMYQNPQQQTGQSPMSQSQWPQQQMGQPPMNQSQMPQQQMGQPSMSQSQMPQQQMGQPPMSQSQMPQQQVGQPPMSQSQMPQQQMGQPPMSQSHIPEQHIDPTQMNQSQVPQQPMGQSPMSNSQMPQQQMGQPPMSQSHLPQQQLDPTQMNQSQMPQQPMGQSPMSHSQMPHQQMGLPPMSQSQMPQQQIGQPPMSQSQLPQQQMDPTEMNQSQLPQQVMGQAPMGQPQQQMGQSQVMEELMQKMKPQGHIDGSNQTIYEQTQPEASQQYGMQPTDPTNLEKVNMFMQDQNTNAAAFGFSSQPDGSTHFSAMGDQTVGGQFSQQAMNQIPQPPIYAQVIDPANQNTQPGSGAQNMQTLDPNQMGQM